MATSTASTALLEGQQLLGTEGLVVDLAGCLDQILKVGSGEEVAEVDKFTVVLVLDVDDAPAVLAAANLLAVDNDCLLATDNRERNDVLESGVNIRSKLIHQCQAYLDLGVYSPLLIIELFIIIRVHLRLWKANSSLMRSLKAWRSSRVRESDFAMTGTTLTTSESFLRTTISMGLRLYRSHELVQSTSK